MMIARTLAACIAGACLIGPALADDAPPGSGDARYSFNKTADGGWLRLNVQTGEVSLCSERTVGWACQAVPDDRAVLENEIARLRRENAVLKKDILARGLPLPAGASSEPPAMSEHQHLPGLNDNADVDRVLALARRAWHRFIDIIARAEKQIMDKS